MRRRFEKAWSATALQAGRDPPVCIRRRTKILRHRARSSAVPALRPYGPGTGGRPRIREKIVYGWRMLYRVEDGVVTIAAIVHSRQSFETGVGRVTRT